MARGAEQSAGTPLPENHAPQSRSGQALQRVASAPSQPTDWRWIPRSENPPSEIWSVGSSGTISRGLQLAFPEIPVNVVSVGHKMNEREIGRAKYYRSEYQFDKAIKEYEMPPFPSAPTYDAKAWKFVKEYAKEGALFWNVGA